MTHITIYEVGPRDGLQNEPALIATKDKISLINQLSQTGLTNIEVTSFVSAKHVPQMGDAEGVSRGIERVKGVTYSALVPNLKGFEAAQSAGLQEIAIFTAASETFAQRNINCSLEQSFERFALIAEEAIRAGIRLRGYVSCITDCPYEGHIDPKQTAHVANRLFELGCAEVSLGDTLGKATPDSLALVLDLVLKDIPADAVAGHFHDTYDRALGNVELALNYGLRVFDTSIAGLGGCPFAPGASGNLSTVKLAEMLFDEGWHTGLDLRALKSVEKFARSLTLGAAEKRIL